MPTENQTLDPYARVDVTVALNLDAHARLQASVDNLFDSNYEDRSSSRQSLSRRGCR